MARLPGYNRKETIMNEKGEKVVFTPPKEFAPPEHQGEEFDLVCSFRAEEGGKLCLVKLGDTDMPGYKKGEHDESIEKMEMEGKHAPDYKSYSKGLVDSLGESSQSPSSY